jgi:hypothetical protein
MPFEYEVYKQQRVSLVSFRRAVTGPPQLNFPDIDDRGYFGLGYGLNRGPIVGVSEESTVVVEMRRERIADQAPLFVTSSDPAVMTVSGENGKEVLALSSSTKLKITGLKGSGGVDPKVEELQVRYGSNKGVIIGVLSVLVFSKLELVITPHLVTIQDKAKTSVVPQIDIAAIIEMAKAVWQPCGVFFTVKEIKHDEFTFAISGQVNIKYDVDTKATELRMLFGGQNYIPKTLNIYFVGEIFNPTDSHENGTGGITYHRAYANSLSINPGVIVAVSNKEQDIVSLACTTAHEIGHFLGLVHTERSPSVPRNDSWTFRMLMHPGNLLPFNAAWLNDVGYGSLNRGCLITLKDLTNSNNREKNLITDPEWVKPRAILHSDAGPY